MYKYFEVSRGFLKLIDEEREVVIKILHYLQEIERRQVVSKRGFSSLFEFSDPKTKGRCESEKFLEFEHVILFSRGDQSSTENLKCFCRAHNQLKANEAFGRDKMKKFVKSLE